MNVTMTLTRADRRRRPLERLGPMPSRSFVKAFLQFLYCQMSNNSQSIIDITNTAQTVSSSSFARISALHPGLASGSDQLYALDGNGVIFRVGNFTAEQAGIVVGTSSTAVAVADDNLVSPIANGSSAGQLTHYGSYGLNYTTGASSASFDLEREFRNDSGGGITVAEIGVYVATCLNATSTSGKSFCILRDVLSPTVTVNNGEYLKVKYTITVSN